MAKHTILSLDLGRDTGWCFSQDGIITHSGVLHLQNIKGKPGATFLHFYNWLVKFKSVKEILYEEVPQFKSRYWAEVYCGLLGQLHSVAYANGISERCKMPGEIKQEFTGQYTADKELVCQTAIELGWRNGEIGTTKNHDEADAIALMWVILNLRGVQPLFIHEVE